VLIACHVKVTTFFCPQQQKYEAFAYKLMVVKDH